MMKTLLIPAVLIALLSAPLTAEADISISVGDPDFYGEIHIGDYPQPRLLYREPVIITRIDQPRPPVYIVVPPGHAKNWGKHCQRYGYCDRPVYFVEEAWYEDIYVPEYRKRHPGKAKGHGKSKRN